MRAGCTTSTTAAESDTTSQVLPLNAQGMQTSNVPLTIPDNGAQTQQIESAYLQDEWKPLAPSHHQLRVRYDHYSAYSSGGELSPRLNFVWQLAPGTTVHRRLLALSDSAAL